MPPVITAENLGKKYVVRQQPGRQPYVALRDVLSDAFRSAGERLLRPFDRKHAADPEDGASIEDFWALRDISFEVSRGERVGIIGRNGAGKSTLLKILSRITVPTTGNVKIKGRVASLLEVGTGFHPELTGRENIFLNGAILGMSRLEIRQKFDDIVTFAEIERFLDTPVKRYSSGMYVRLAFAVAAHLNPEILIIDEVLAVGDALFQKKCLDKMNSVANSGNTVIFVSHNMGIITSFCDKAFLLDKGFVAASGDVATVVDLYLHTGVNSQMFNDKIHLSTVNPFMFTGIDMRVDGTSTRTVTSGGNLEFVLSYSSLEISGYLRFGLHILDSHGSTICILSPNQQFPEFAGAMPLVGAVGCSIPEITLLPGEYYITLQYTTKEDGSSDIMDRIFSFEVVEGDVYGTGIIPSKIHGLIFVKADWKFES